MTDFEKFQNNLLKKLGYDAVPFYGDDCPKYIIFKDDDEKFHFYDGQANESHRESDVIRGDILVKYDNKGFHYCPSFNSEGEYVLFYPNKYNEEVDYFILRENDEYIKLNSLGFYGMHGSSFYYINNEHYFAIRFHSEDMTEQERCEEKPFLETIISKGKDICHIEVFTYYFKDKIVVYDKGEKVIVYDEEFNVIYEGYGDFKIWEKDSNSFLIIPNSSELFELTEGKVIKLSEEDCYWEKARTYKDIFVLYTEHHRPTERTDWNGEPYLEYDNKNAPIESTDGCIYDLNFKLLREFNVLGKIVKITDWNDTKVMMVDDSYYNGSYIKCFNVYGTNLTRHNEDTDEDFSVPDISPEFYSHEDAMYDALGGDMEAI